MATAQSLILSEQFNFSIWIEANIADNANISIHCRNSLDILSKLQKQFANDDLRMTLAFGKVYWDSLGHTAEGAELKDFPSYGNGLAPATQCDLLIHIQSLSFDANFTCAQDVLSEFANDIIIKSEEHGFRKGESRGIEGFVDGTENPHQIDDIRRIAIIADDKPDASGSYIVLQKYVHNLNKWESFNINMQEEAVGRSKAENIEFTKDIRHIRSHLTRTNLKEDGVGLKIVRRSLPFGKVSAEHGLMFVAYCATLHNIEAQLQSMFGDTDGKTDLLLERLSTAVSGAYYFAPSIERLMDL
ncbi:MAG: Dyp-type peroxidase [Neisseriaceae bacterium]|nr:Dyp-type peroxidase [Neisseriaceae bacterium]